MLTRKILLLLGLALIVGFWWKSTYPPTSPVMNEAITTVSATTRSIDDPATNMTPMTNSDESVARENDRVVDSKNRDVIRKCLSESQRSLPLNETTQLEDLVREFGASGAVLEHLTMNIHVRGRDGNVLRLHLGPHDSEKTKDRYAVGASDIRLFKVDSENLPEPIPFPADLRLASASDVVDRFSNSGEVMFRERRSYRRFKNGDAASTVETDGTINEMQLFFGGRSVGCAWLDGHLACDCL